MLIKPIVHALEEMESVSLEALDAVRLLNRTNRKYIVPNNLLQPVLEHLKKDYKVLTIDHKNSFRYHSRYFDTHNFQFFYDHHNKKPRRIKVRFRSYLDTEESFFEIKYKHNSRTEKYRDAVNTINLSLNKKQTDLVWSNYHTFKPFSKLYQRPLIPTIENTYERITLMKKDKSERCTIDVNLKFQSPNKTSWECSYEDMAIIEVKQLNNSITKGLNATMRSLNVRPVGISKYVLGIISCHPEVKHNRFLPMLRKVNQACSDTVI